MIGNRKLDRNQNRTKTEKKKTALELYVARAKVPDGTDLALAHDWRTHLGNLQGSTRSLAILGEFDPSRTCLGPRGDGTVKLKF